MEYFDIRDEYGNITGEVKERTQVHRDGDWHGTAHVWLVRSNKGNIEILLQKRSAEKDAFPGCYDISSAGHIPAGSDFLESAIRELREELGVNAGEEELCFIGIHRHFTQTEFYGQPFRNAEFSRVYAMWKDMKPEELTLQAEEVDAVMWISLNKCYALVEKEEPQYCIFLEELKMLKKWAEKRRIYAEQYKDTI